MNCFEDVDMGQKRLSDLGQQVGEEEEDFLFHPWRTLQ